MLSFKDDFKGFEYMWRNGGKTRDDQKVEFKDALATPEAGYFIPRVLTNAVQEAVEPLLMGPKLLKRLQFQPGTFISLPTMGAIDGDFDMAEEEEYPEHRVNLGPGTAITAVGKQGAAVKFSEEILRYSSFDVVTMHTQAVAKAMARFKERKIFKMLLNNGALTHDNQTPGNAQFGNTTGRGLNGAANGSLRMEDLLECYSAVLANGFMPDLLLVHPLTWLMFLQDPVLRAFSMQAGGGPWFQQWTGNPGDRDLESAFGGQGVSGSQYRVLPQATQEANSPLTAFSQNLTSAPILPSYFGHPLRILVSPFIPYDTANNRTDLILADSAELGYLIVDEDLTVSDWTDPKTDILKVKLKERYMAAPSNEGLGIGVMRNIVVTPNEIVLPAQAQIDVGGAIDVLNRGVVVG